MWYHELQLKGNNQGGPVSKDSHGIPLFNIIKKVTEHAKAHW